MSGFAKWMASACCWSSSPQPRLVIFINFVSLSLFPSAGLSRLGLLPRGGPTAKILIRSLSLPVPTSSTLIRLIQLFFSRWPQRNVYNMGCGFLDSIVSAALNRSRHDVDVSLLCRARLEDDPLYRKPLFGFSLLFLLLLPPPHSLRHRLFRLERDSVSDVTPTGLPPFSRRGSASTASGDSPERKWCWHAQNQRFFSFSLFLARLSVRRERPFSLLEEVGHRIGDVYRSSLFFSFDVASATFPSSDDDFYWISYTTPPTTSSSVARISNRILPLYAVIQRCPAPVQLCNNPPPPAARYRITPLVKYLLPLIATLSFPIHCRSITGRWIVGNNLRRVGCCCRSSVNPLEWSGRCWGYVTHNHTRVTSPPPLPTRPLGSVSVRQSNNRKAGPLPHLCWPSGVTSLWQPPTVTYRLELRLLLLSSLLFFDCAVRIKNNNRKYYGKKRVKGGSQTRPPPYSSARAFDGWPNASQSH